MSSAKAMNDDTKKRNVKLRQFLMNNKIVKTNIIPIPGPIIAIRSYIKVPSTIFQYFA